MHNYSFPKSRVLNQKGEISRIFAEGSFWRSDNYKFKYLRGERFGLVISVSKRVGSSPERNRIKRLVREAIRQRGDLDQQPWQLALFITNPPQSQPQLVEMQAILAKLFDHLHEVQRP